MTRLGALDSERRSRHGSQPARLPLALRLVLDPWTDEDQLGLALREILFE